MGKEAFPMKDSPFLLVPILQTLFSKKDEEQAFEPYLLGSSCII
jgi:hypothetical protein